MERNEKSQPAKTILFNEEIFNEDEKEEEIQTIIDAFNKETENSNKFVIFEQILESWTD